MNSERSRRSTTPSFVKSPSAQLAIQPVSNMPLVMKLAESSMSIVKSRSVSPGAAKATVTEPSALLSQPTERLFPEAIAAAAADEVMPLEPVQFPPPRPAASHWRMVAIEAAPLATVNRPLPMSTVAVEASTSDARSAASVSMSKTSVALPRTSMPPVPSAAA